MACPQKVHGRLPGFPYALAAAVFLSAALPAETIVQNLTWSLCQYASIDGNILTVDVPESATNRSWMCSATELDVQRDDRPDAVRGERNPDRRAG